MERDSFIFYRSYYEAIKDLPRDIQGEVFTAIMEYGLYGITTENLKPVAKSIFILVKPLLDSSIKKYENGSRGGRPRGQQKPNENQDETKPKPNENQDETKSKPNYNKDVDVDSNYNENVNLSLFSGGDTAEKDKFLFDDIFWEFFRNNRKNPMSETRRFCDYYSSQGWRKSGGQKVTQVEPLVRIWKCADDKARFFPEIQDFFVAAIDTAPEAERPALAMAIRGARFDGNLFKVTCTRRFVDFIEAKENADKIKPLFHKYLPNKEWKYEQIVTI